MKKFQDLIHDVKRKEIIDRSSAPKADTVIERDQDVLKKFASDECYELEDFLKEVPDVIGSEIPFKVLNSVYEFAEKLKDVELRVDRPFFCIFPISEKLWCMFCIVKKIVEEKPVTNVLYKDPSGDDVPDILKKYLNAKFRNIKITINAEKDVPSKDQTSFGPCTLRNLKICAWFLKQRQDYSLFSRRKFAKRHDLTVARLRYLTDVFRDVSQNKDLTKMIQKFTTGSVTDVCSNIDDLSEALKNETENGEKYISEERVQSIREQYVGEKKMEKFTKEYEKESKNIEEVKLVSKEYGKLQILFIVISVLKKDLEPKHYNTILQTISAGFNIKYELFEKLYRLEVIVKPEEKNEVTKEDPKQPSKEISNDGTPLDEFVKFIQIGLDPADPSKPRNDLDEKVAIRVQYKKYLTMYDQVKAWTYGEIKAWGMKMKHMYGNTEDDTIYALALLNRMFVLLENHTFRIPQVVSVLIFLRGSEKKGRLCQIKTGEGKTTIVAMLAIIKCLQGCSVDVITSNAVLASEGVSETIRMFQAFGMSVATNNPGEYKDAYKVDVLYGCISNFQFDYLKEMTENITIRQNRSFDVVILDEVDSMLIDNGGNFAKIAAKFPGMECLRYIYIKIWQELKYAEQSFLQETLTKVDEIRKAYSNDESVKQKKTKEYLDRVYKNEREAILGKIKSDQLTDLAFRPGYLDDYVETQLNAWIGNAIYAKYLCLENQHYRIVAEEGSDEKEVMPIDYRNTGITLKNTVWSNGLHQFIQLKHNLKLTFETLTSTCISNIGYIKKYESAKIFGMTGTLGSRTEQLLLHSVYTIDFAKLPTYKKKDFEELPGHIFDDESWAVDVTMEIMKKIDQKRAVLAICLTISDVLLIESRLNTLKKFSKIVLRIYKTEDDFKNETKRPDTDVGHVILATNLAGRGTNFKTTKSLEKNRGLHVFVCFLPSNLRVEQQAFGRTSRQGKRGTAQLLIRQSELEDVAIFYKSPSFEKVKESRDKVEAGRLRRIQDVLVPELDFMDAINDLFCKLLVSLKNLAHGPSRWFVEDLKQKWAFFLHTKNFNHENITSTPAEVFKVIADDNAIPARKITLNPYFLIGQAEDYLRSKKLKEAKVTLDRALSLRNEEDARIYAGAHFKLFEYHLRTPNIELYRTLEILVHLAIPMPLPRLPLDILREYIPRAKSEITKAHACLKMEVDCIENLFKEESPFYQILITPPGESKDIKLSSNPLCAQLLGRLNLLKLHCSLIDHIKQKFNEIGNDYIALGPTKFADVEICMKLIPVKQQKDMKPLLTPDVLAESRRLGLHRFYSALIFYRPPTMKLNISKINIIAGATMIVVAAIFGCIPVVQYGISLVSMGIVDIILVIVSNGWVEPDRQGFLRDQLIQHAVSAAFLGFSFVLQYTQIVQKVLSMVRKVADILRHFPVFTGVFLKLAQTMERVIDALTIAANLYNMIDKSRTATQIIIGAIKSIAINVGKAILAKVVLPAITEMMLKDMENDMKNHLTNALKSSEDLVDKLERHSDDEVLALVKKFEMKDSSMKKWLKRLETMLARQGTQKIMLVIAAVGKMPEFHVVCHALVAYLRKNLSSKNERCNNEGSLIRKIVENMSEVINKFLSEAAEYLSIASEVINKSVDLLIDGKVNLQSSVLGLEINAKTGKINLSKIFGFTPKVSREATVDNIRRLVLLLDKEKDKSQKEKLNAKFEEIFKNLPPS